MTTSLITGDRGFVGRHLTAYLEAWGDRVYGYDTSLGHDVRDYEALRGIVERVNPDRIFHLAAQASPQESITNPRRAVDVNVGGALNLLEAVRHTASEAHVLLVGTSEEYGYENQRGPVTEDSPCLPTTPYGVTKLAAGQLGLAYAARYGLHVVAVRPFNHAGPGQHPRYAVSSFARQVVRAERRIQSAVWHGDLTSVRNYTDVRDVVRAYHLAVDLRPDVYNVCSNQSVTMHHVLQLLIQLSGADIPTKLDTRRAAAGNLIWHEPSCEKLKTLTGWRAERPLEETLRDVLDWWKANL